MVARVVILGGGVGGTTIANRLARRHDVEVTVIDNHGRHLYQPGLLYVPLNGRTPSDWERDESTLLRRSVALRVGRVLAVDPEMRRIKLEGNDEVAYDWLVIATGSRVYHDDSMPGLKEHGLHFHCAHASMRLRERLASFTGGRVVIGASALPYKCPPSIIEFALLFDEWLRLRGLRDRTDITFTYPLADVFPKAEVAPAVRQWLTERNIRIETSFVPAVIEAQAVTSHAGRRLDHDLLIMVPPHRGAPYLRGSPLAGPSGFVPCDPHTLRVRGRGFVVGDSADLSVPKSGAAAHFQAPVVARNIADEIDGNVPSADYDGRVGCFLESDRSHAAYLTFDYDHAPKPPKLTRFNRFKKAIMNTFYWSLVKR